MDSISSWLPPINRRFRVFSDTLELRIVFSKAAAAQARSHKISIQQQQRSNSKAVRRQPRFKLLPFRASSHGVCLRAVGAQQ